MKNKTTINKIIIFFSFVFLFLVVEPASAAFGLPGAVNKLSGGYKSIYGATPVELPVLIGSIIQIVLSLLGLVFFVLTFYGGYVWLLAKGDEKEVEKAQGILRMAVIGLLIIVSAYAISYFVFSSLTKASGVNL